MNSNAEVGMIPVKQNEDGPATLLRDVAKITDSTMPQEYDRINQRRIVSITANVVGEDLGRAVTTHRRGHHGGRRPAARREGGRRHRPHPRPGAGHAADVQRPGQRPGAGRGRRVPDADRLFPVDQAGVRVGGDDAGGGGGRGLRAVHHPHDAEHPVVHGRDHGGRRGGGQRHSAGHLRREGPADRHRRGRGSPHRRRGASAADLDDQLRHDRRHGSDGPGPGRRRRAERPAGPGRHRRPGRRHRRHAADPAGGLHRGHGFEQDRLGVAASRRSRRRLLRPAEPRRRGAGTGPRTSPAMTDAGHPTTRSSRCVPPCVNYHGDSRSAPSDPGRPEFVVSSFA